MPFNARSKFVLCLVALSSTVSTHALAMDVPPAPLATTEAAKPAATAAPRRATVAPASTHNYVYRCGTIYSQAPCGSGTEAVILHAGNSSALPAGQGDFALCSKRAVEASRTTDPSSARVVQVGARVADVIDYGSRPIVSHRYELTIEAMNDAGVITRPQPMTCWLSEDRARVLQFKGAR
jgi:hypothetical protein